MKQIEVKPIQVESIHVSPVLVTSTSIESIYVSGENGETVNTRPRWVEVDREYDEPYCMHEGGTFSGYLTGEAYQAYTIIYEDQNENSATYGTTKSVCDSMRYTDTANCPLPLTAPLPNEGLYPNAVQDYDGNYYDAVIIGNQVWLASNLYTLHYANGDSVSNVRYPNNDSNLKEEYGVLYNYDTITKGVTLTDPDESVQGIAPNGWHVPSKNELNDLLAYLYTNKYYSSNSTNYRCITKSLSSKDGWHNSVAANTPGYSSTKNNKTNFNAKPAGYTFGQFNNVEFFTRWCMIHSCTLKSELTNSFAFCWSYELNEVTSTSFSVTNCASVRCIYNGTVEQFLASYSDLTIPDRGLYPNAVQDYDGNYYDAVILGNQVWLGSNLRTTHYADGTEINSNDYTTPMEDENTVADISKYGLLYNFNAVMNGASSSHTVPSGVQGIAPNGWHIPSHDEILVMTRWVGSQDDFAYNAPSNIAKALASKEGWFSSGGYIAGSPGSTPSENNATRLNVYPNYNGGGAPVPLVSYGASLVTCTQQDTYSGDDDYLHYYHFGISFNYATCYITTSYGYLSTPCGVRCLYNGTVSEFLENYVNLNPSYL